MVVTGKNITQITIDLKWSLSPLGNMCGRKMKYHFQPNSEYHLDLSGVWDNHNLEGVVLIQQYLNEKWDLGVHPFREYMEHSH